MLAIIIMKKIIHINDDTDPGNATIAPMQAYISAFNGQIRKEV
jgi:hypothetical protein